MAYIRAFASLPALILSLAAWGLSGCGDESSASSPLVEEPGQDGGAEDANEPLDASKPDGNTGKDSSPPDGSEPDSVAPLPASLLEVYALDIWAQALPSTEGALSVTLDGKPVPTSGWPIVRVPLTKAGTYTLSLSAPEHFALDATVQFDGTSSDQAAKLSMSTAVKGHGVSFSHDVRKEGGADVSVHTAYLGLRHKWFSAEGRPARRGNDIELLMDGEQAWARVAQELSGAAYSVLIASWWWQSDFELVRPQNHATLTPDQRWANTVLGILEDSSAFRRVLVGQFWGQDSILSFMTTDGELKAFAETPGDGFEFMGQGNPTKGTFTFSVDPFLFGDRVRGTWTDSAGRKFATEDQVQSQVPPHDVDLGDIPTGIQTQIASYHQKFSVIDEEVAFVGGMNLKEVDWDSSKHEVYDFRRMKYDASQADRLAVQAKEQLPDNGPRKDYAMRIHGPAAQDVADVFHLRWKHQLDEGVEYAANSTDFTVQRNIAPQPGGKHIQVTVTLPQPFWEHSIAETWFNAVAQAEKYIYIEDQYFRMPMVNDAIVARMQAVPTLRLVVITKDINEWTDPGCPWTYKSHAVFKQTFPDRYKLFVFRSFDTSDSPGWDEVASQFQDIDVHAKMLIVDDKFMSVGSCNKNNRGLVYEGEMNVAVVDEPWVKNERKRIFANFLPDGTAVADDVAGWWQQLIAASAANDAVYAAWDQEGWDISLDGAPLPAEYTPQGILYSMDFPDSGECLIENVGPDIMGTEQGD